MPTITTAVIQAGGGFRTVQGTIIADLQQYYGSATWNNGAVAFTALKIAITNTASAAGSLLMDFQVDGVSQFRVDKAGATINGACSVPTGVLGLHAGTNYFAATPSASGSQGRGVVYAVAAGSNTAPFIGCRSDGTFASPTAVTVAGGSLAYFGGDGYDGTNWATGGSMSFAPSETWSGSSRGSVFAIATIAIGATSTADRLSLNEVGLSLPQVAGTGGNIGVGTTAIVGQAIRIVGTQTTRTDQYGIIAAPTFNASATTSGTVFYAQGTTAAAAFTQTALYGLYVEDASKGAGSTITTQYGVHVAAQTKGATNWAIFCASSPTSGGVAFRNTALATGATVGHFFIPSSAGAPTGVPATIPTGQIAMQYDSTNNFLYVYNGGWKKSTVYA